MDFEMFAAYHNFVSPTESVLFGVCLGWEVSPAEKARLKGLNKTGLYAPAGIGVHVSRRTYTTSVAYLGRLPNRNALEEMLARLIVDVKRITHGRTFLVTRMPNCKEVREAFGMYEDAVS